MEHSCAFVKRHSNFAFIHLRAARCSDNSIQYILLNNIILHWSSSHVESAGANVPVSGKQEKGEDFFFCVHRVCVCVNSKKWKLKARRAGKVQ